MRKKLIYKLLFVFQLLILSSCVHENFNEVVGQNAHGHDVHSVKEIQYEELLKTNSRFRGLHDKVMKINNQTKLMSRGSFENANGFTIVNTAAKIVETDSIISYTLLVEKDVTEIGSFDNLVIQTDKNGERPSAYLLTYKPTEMMPSAHGSFRFKGKVLRKNLPLEALSFRDSATRCGESVTFTVCTESWTTRGTTGDEHLATTACDDSSFKTTYRVQIICDSETGLGMGNGSTGNFSIGIPWDGVGGPGGTPSNNGVYTPPTEPDDIIANPVTSPVPPRNNNEPPKTPCDLLKKLGGDLNFRGRMKGLGSASTAYAFEKLHTIYNNVGLTAINNSYNYQNYQGSVGTPQVNYDYNASIMGQIHSHYQDLLSIFSVSDLVDLYQKMKNPDISNDYFMGVVAPQGNAYILQINNRANFVAFGDKYLSNVDKIKDFSKNIVQKTYGILQDNTADFNEKAFLKMMLDFNTGTDVAKTTFNPNNLNSDPDIFKNWQKIKYNPTSYNVETNNCN